LPSTISTTRVGGALQRPSLGEAIHKNKQRVRIVEVLEELRAPNSKVRKKRIDPLHSNSKTKTDPTNSPSPRALTAGSTRGGHSVYRLSSAEEDR